MVLTATVTRTTTWTDGQILTATALNGEFDNLLNALAIVNADISASAAISITKISTGLSGSLVGTTDTQTLTNKRVNPRVVSTTDDSTSVINVDTTDSYILTAVANDTTFTISGTPVNEQKLLVRFKDAGVAKNLTWTGFTNRGATMPTVTIAGKWHRVGFIYNSTASTFDCVAAIVEA